ncbi:MAG: efflux RND transporter periplasmic adaptor subunit [Muribaculaceae bacterium]|nr:efflux RND transporter periplasmic adaptor subunit [Muribaculaceae bacterium]
MRHNIPLILALSLALPLVSACSHKPHAHDEEEATDNHDHAPGVIALDSIAAGRFGVQLDTLTPAPFHSVVRAAGRVMEAGADDAIVAAPTAGIVKYAPGIEAGARVGKGSLVARIDSRGLSGGDANAAAEAEVEAARLELDRVEDLYAERLATQAELIAAQAAYKRATTAYSPAAASSRATAPTAGTLTSLLVKEGQYVAVGDPIATLAAGRGSLLRVELPRRYYGEAASLTDMVADFAGGRRVRVSELGGRRTGGNPTADASSTGAYIPLYFTVQGAGAPAGTPFTAYLIGAERPGVLSVPAGAVSEQQGRFYVYVCMSPGHFMKMPVSIGDTDGFRTEITSGLKPGDVVVAEGMAAVRLAETSAVAPQGHSHNH